MYPYQLAIYTLHTNTYYVTHARISLLSCSTNFSKHSIYIKLNQIIKYTYIITRAKSLYGLTYAINFYFEITAFPNKT